jgi:hypothetical protein
MTRVVLVIPVPSAQHGGGARAAGPQKESVFDGDRKNRVDYFIIHDIADL